MKIIGITGGSGTGKTTVAEIFKKNGAYIIDADKLAREILDKDSQYLSDIVQIIGPVVLNKDNTLNRKVLTDIIYKNKIKKEELNQITYKHVVPEIIKEIETHSEEKLIVLDVILLIESGLSKKCDIIISIISSMENRIKRICTRDAISEELAINRINMQNTEEFYINNSDYILENNSDLKELEKKIINSWF